MTHFTYRSSQRKTAVIVVFNILILLLMWKIAHILLTIEKYGNSAAELLYWANICVPIICLLLLIVACLLWLNNKNFVIELSKETLKVYDPLFKTFTWEVPIKRVKEIRHHFCPHTKYSKIEVIMLNDQRHQLTMNYGFSRAKLYAEISKLAPAIILPKHPNKFPRKAQ